jgi:hypothetical protein
MQPGTGVIAVMYQPAAAGLFREVSFGLATFHAADLPVGQLS